MALSGCVHVQDAAYCAAAGKVTYGGLCAHLRSSDTFSISGTELLDFLDAQPETRICVPKGHWIELNNEQMWQQDLPVCADDQSVGTAAILPPRGASIIMTAAQWGEMKSELEQACRDLGNQCDYARLEKAIQGVRP